MSAKVFTLSKEVLEILSKPFDAKTLGVIPISPTNAGQSSVLLALYIQHTDCYGRIEKVDPAWSSKILGVQMGAKYCNVWVELTILGVTRANMGEGADLKSATSDAIKRAAMLFGVARYLYDAEPVWVDYRDSEDRYRTWTYADYERGRKREQPPVPIGISDAASASPSRPKSKDEIEEELFRVAKQLGLEDQQLFDWAEDYTGKDLDKIAVADLERFLAHLQSDASKNGPPSRKRFGR